MEPHEARIATHRTAADHGEQGALLLQLSQEVGIVA